MSVAGIAGVTGPAVVEVWSASCAECRAMSPRLEDVSSSYSDRVEFVVLDAAKHVPQLRTNGIIATPTLVGIRDGREVFRLRGGLSRAEIEQLFEAVAAGTDPPRAGMADVWIRTGAGVMLVGVGLAAGPAWLLVVVGGLVAGYGLHPLVKTIR